MSSVNLSTLSIGTYANGMTLWLYHTKDSRRAVEGHEYWSDINHPNIKGHIQPGDFIFIRHDESFGAAKTITGNSIYVMGQNGRTQIMCSTFKDVSFY